MPATYANSITLDWSILSTIAFIAIYMVLVPLTRAFWFVPVGDYVKSLANPDEDDSSPLRIVWFVIMVAVTISLSTLHMGLLAGLLLWDVSPDGSSFWLSLLKVFHASWLVFTFWAVSALYSAFMIGMNDSELSRKQIIGLEILWVLPVLVAPVLLKIA